ncbi:hypothetical protein BSZ39_04850 [Bowdeniella nasicola]|uniref:Primosomal protein N' 3' DNA-binding domain-containing protein n=1 Tax=Bowdeniella nasicola TaxID=208480 RepID=A0A1Q5Q3C2_9ACTO|nr:hypothetical protein [Bowdeniella nasicola]OKL54297.1 hypothetical protein BSZ39_04850 [Bowdeniella nasicola]
MTDQPELPGLALPAPERHRGPVAVVRLDLPAPHLDAEYDYALPDNLAATARIGQRITARFGPSDRQGFITALTDGSDHPGDLKPLRTIVSDLPVLTEEVYRAATQVATHYAGTVSDVLRLAIPPRHARTEKSVTERVSSPARPAPPRSANGELFRAYPDGDHLLQRLASGASPCLVRQVVPGVIDGNQSIIAEAVELAMATLASARRAIIIVPAARDIDSLVAALSQAGIPAIGYGSAQSPPERYRSFLLALLGQVDVVVGTRSAAWAPLPDLGATIVLDEADPLLRERHAPRPQVWRIALARAGATIFLSYGRSLQTQLLIERGEADSSEPSRDALRAAGARVLDGDPTSGPLQRLPSIAVAVAREALQRGPVLFLVPRAGYVNVVRCQRCGADARCPSCASPVSLVAADRARCIWAGHLTTRLVCRHCEGTHFRSGAFGSERTAEELGRAFPGTLIRLSGARTGIIERVDDRPAIVVATPGAEPLAPNGYEAAIALDVSVMTSRTELSATAHALTQLANAWALVKPAHDGGRFVLTGRSDEYVTQTLIRADFPRAARDQLAERAELHLPPVACVAELTAAKGNLRDVAMALSDVAPGAEVLGPIAVSEDRDRLLIRVPHAGAPALRTEVAALIRRRSVRGESPISATMDPLDL